MKSYPSQSALPSDAGSSLMRSVIDEYKRGGSDKAMRTVAQANMKRTWEGDQVRVRLKELLPVLLQAAVDQSAWLDDFADETIVMSKDFHEVLAVFQQMRKMTRAAA